VAVDWRSEQRDIVQTLGANKGSNLTNMGFPGLDLSDSGLNLAEEKVRRNDSGVSGFDCIYRPSESEGLALKHSRVTDNSVPVPIGFEPPPSKSVIDILLHGKMDIFSLNTDKFPTQFYPVDRNAGIFRMPSESPLDFEKRYPTLTEYNKRVSAGDHEQQDYEKSVKAYAKTLDPKERELIAKEYEQYNKDCERMSGVGIYTPHQGPHLKAYLEQVEALKQAAHATEQARRQAIGAELGPAFKKEAEGWQAARWDSMLSE
jgi:hypothetical protein